AAGENPTLPRRTIAVRHCEERSDEAIQEALDLRVMAGLFPAIHLFIPSESSETPHPNASGLHDGEMSRPIVALRNQLEQPAPSCTRRGHWYAEQHDPTGGRRRRSVGEFAEILVEREQDALFLDRQGQHIVIGRSRRFCPYPKNIVPGCPKSSYRRTGEILV